MAGHKRQCTVSLWWARRSKIEIGRSFKLDDPKNWTAIIIGRLSKLDGHPKLKLDGHSKLKLAVHKNKTAINERNCTVSETGRSNKFDDHQSWMVFQIELSMTVCHPRLTWIHKNLTVINMRFGSNDRPFWTVAIRTPYRTFVRVHRVLSVSEPLRIPYYGLSIYRIRVSE